MQRYEATAGLRRAMVADQIRARGVTDSAVLAAMEAVPRELFVSAETRPLAYEDRALPIDEDQTISQPYIVAFMTQALRVGPHHRVLEVGTGSGYQCAILARLTDRILTVERHASLAQAAAERLASLGMTGVEFHVGDGSLGWPAQAPYDRIIVTAAAPHLPDPLVNQLAEDGRLVLPLGDAHQQTLVTVIKRAGRTLEFPSIACRFVKLIGQAAWA